MNMQDDLWAAWLSHGRHGGGEAAQARVAAATQGYAAKLLAALHLPARASLLDIGSGEGLVGFAALAEWPDLAVSFTDISAPLLAKAASRAAALGVAGQCRFLQCPASALAPVAAGSQDALTSRSALAYEADKPAAFAEFFRVLRPGGQMSLAEPLFRDEALAAMAMRDALAAPHAPQLALLHRWKAAQFPDTPALMAANPLTNYSERDLLGMARAAGFVRLQLELHISLDMAPARPWAEFIASSPHPWAPPLAQILRQHFSPAEALALEQGLRPAVEAGTLTQANRMVYLSGAKPEASSSSSSSFTGTR